MYQPKNSEFFYFFTTPTFHTKTHSRIFIIFLQQAWTICLPWKVFHRTLTAAQDGEMGESRESRVLVQSADTRTHDRTQVRPAGIPNKVNLDSFIAF